MNNHLAQKLLLPGTSEAPIVVQGPLTKFDTLGDVVTDLLPIVISMAGLILLGILIWGGYDILFSGGDQAKIQSGKDKIVNGVIGFIIVFGAYFLTQFAGFIFGFSIF